MTMTINIPLFVVICVFAFIGAFVVFWILLYFVAGVLDYTYHERHKTLKKEEKPNECPEYIESEEEKK